MNNITQKELATVIVLSMIIGFLICMLVFGIGRS